MNIKPIETEEDYQVALKRLEVVFEAEPNTPESGELEVLSILIENYEETHFPIEMPDHIEAIRFRMEQLNYSKQYYS